MSEKKIKDVQKNPDSVILLGFDENSTGPFRLGSEILLFPCEILKILILYLFFSHRVL